MATLGEALMDALGGDVGPGAGVSPRTAAWGLVGALGGVSQAARELGVPRSTFRRWLAGSTPKGGGEWIAEAARDAWRDRAEGPGSLTEADFRVTGTYDYASGGSMKGCEDRDIPLGTYMRPGTLDAVVEAYRAGADAEELGEIAADGINDRNGFYRDTFDPANPRGSWDITSVSFG